MNKILTKLITIFSLAILFNCGASNGKEHYIQWMKDNAIFVKHPNYEGRRSADPMDKYLKGFNANQVRPEGEAGCTVVEMHPWKKDNIWGWGRYWSWQEWNSSVTHSTGITLDSDEKKSSSYLAKRKAEDPKKSDYWGEFIYIGPWKNVPKIDKEIRFVAMQSKVYGGLSLFFESKTPENAKIREMSEIKLVHSPENNLDYCKVLWIKTYGYNAVFDMNSKKIIEAKE